MNSHASNPKTIASSPVTAMKDKSGFKGQQSSEKATKSCKFPPLPTHVTKLIHSRDNDLYPLEGLAAHHRGLGAFCARDRDKEEEQLLQFAGKGEQTPRDEKETESSRTRSKKILSLPRCSCDQEEGDDDDEVDYATSEEMFPKIEFSGVVLDLDQAPSWAVLKQKRAAENIRFNLPSDLKRLEGVTPMEFLTGYTSLHYQQRRSYYRIFRNFRNKETDLMEKKNLYPALNVLFANSLGEPNYHVLVKRLHLLDVENINFDMFVGICAFCDRKYWKMYFESTVNRPPLEALDFHNLDKKMYRVNISEDLQLLLLSLH
ncbi:uncharacterized protein LOC101849531 [Aplysia californica]|uniref:Uncharacterized protein LOC101849531 n=1 Tax=Aplysia californica TaxID=6500 RepID=A0ABM0JK30_APLCA|nr:uncharacterized protein LOC101849531 [Aplysia californica]